MQNALTPAASRRLKSMIVIPDPTSHTDDGGHLWKDLPDHLLGNVLRLVDSFSLWRAMPVDRRVADHARHILMERRDHMLTKLYIGAKFRSNIDEVMIMGVMQQEGHVFVAIDIRYRYGGKPLRTFKRQVHFSRHGFMFIRFGRRIYKC